MPQSAFPSQSVSFLSWRHPISLIATGFGTGRLPKMPGTWGSLLGVLIAQSFLIATLEWGAVIKEFFHIEMNSWFFMASMLLGFLFLLFAVGWWASSLYQRHAALPDPKEVVIDEIAGQTLVLYGILPVHFLIPIETNAMQAGVIFAAFLLFRLFDMLKPWPISWMDQHIKGGFGIMLDDMAAAILALLSFYAGVLLLMDLKLL